MCCGKEKTNATAKVIDIGKSHLKSAVSRLFPRMPILKQSKEESEKRIKICVGCDELTHLTLAEYAAWLAKNSITVIDNFTRLDTLPPLEKKKKTESTNAYCSVCKCPISAKIWSNNEKCPLNKW
jgi:hypothetical protein